MKFLVKSNNINIKTYQHGIEIKADRGDLGEKNRKFIDDFFVLKQCYRFFIN